MTTNRRKPFHMLTLRIAVVLLCLCVGGCAAIPQVEHQPQFHNPFPQLSRVAVLPFYNLSDDPTVNQLQFAIAYQTELQQIPGFEVMPVGVVQRFLETNQIIIDGTTDFQRLAQALDVDAIVVGAVTDFDEYYPPRMGLSVSWYAANPSFHPIPPGYGLPWGRAEEEYIPESLVFEAEFALAREQLKTQTPNIPRAVNPPGQQQQQKAPDASPAKPSGNPAEQQPPANQSPTIQQTSGIQPFAGAPGVTPGQQPRLPEDWPDPRGFIPHAPYKQRPPYNPQRRPILRQVRQYNSNDGDFTDKLSNYYFFRDDARFGGWQAYLQRKDDFIRFCSYLHITEMLAARGGADKTRVVWRWPIDRYDR